MTLLEKITRELPDSRVEPAELNGRPAWRITIAKADSTDGGTFEALVYQEAARVQIRHLDQYQAASCAVEYLKSSDKWCPPHRRRHDWPGSIEEAWKRIDHFKGLSGFTLAVPMVPAPETARTEPSGGTCSICPRGEGKCARHGKRRMAP